MPDQHPDPASHAGLLAALARVCGDPDRFERDMVAFLKWYEGQAELQAFLENPTVSEEGKLASLEQILRNRVSSELLLFLLLLQERAGLRHIAAIWEFYFARVARKGAGLLGELQSPIELPPDKIRAIEAEVGRILGANVRLEPRVMPGLVGGLVVRVGDFVLDGSLDAELSRIRERLLAG